MPLDAGKRDTRITFLREAKTQTATGETERAWKPAFSVWARVVMPKVTEAVRNGTTAKDARYAINVRWMPGFDVNDTGYRIDLNGLVLEIATMVETERRTEIEIVAHRQS